VIAKINDPLRAAAYADLGITTLCRTNLMGAAVNDFLGLDLTFGPGISEATGHHPGGEHHADAPGPGGPSGQGNPAAPPAAGGAGASSAGSTGSASGPGAAPGSGPAGSSASTLTPATPVAAREG
jgi:hypothetical protein